MTKRQNGKDHGWMSKIFAGILATMLLGIISPGALADETSADEACAAELRGVRSYIEANQATLSFPDAVGYLLANAPSCDVHDPPRSESSENANVYTLADAGVTTFATTLGFVCEGDDCAEGETTDGAAGSESEIIDCVVGGAGPGTVTGTVLGFQLLEEPGAGSWEPQNGVIEVTGEGATVGGTQLDSLGEIRILKTLPLPANEGSTGATCLKTIKTQTDVHRHCWAVWFFIVIIYCEENVTTTTEVTIEPCTGSASQILSLPVALDRTAETRLSTELVRVDHEYAEDPNPCEGAEAIAALFG